MEEELYFKHSDSEYCHTKEYFIECMKERNVHYIEVYKAEKERFYGVFWCKYLGFCGDDTTATCGKQCDYYEPRNKVSGCCRHHTNTMYAHGDKIKIEL